MGEEDRRKWALYRWNLRLSGGEDDLALLLVSYLGLEPYFKL
jgi:hypothetical protein